MKRLCICALFAAFVICGLAVPARVSAAELPDAVVFYDKTFPVSWMQRGVSQEINEFMNALGFATLDNNAVAGWMKDAIEKGARGRLIVMAHDVMPSSLVGDAPSSPALIRKYLDAGGSVIWISDVPFYFIGEPKKDKIKWDYLGGRGVLGFDTVGNWQGQMEAKAVKLGAEWGLKSSWTSMRAVKPGDVTNILAADSSGAASAWTKQYAEGSLGFIRLWDGPVTNFSDTMAEDLYRIASKVILRIASVKRNGGIYLFQPSDYYPLARREGGGIIRDVQVSAFNSSPEPGGAYALKIMRAGKLLKKIEIGAANSVFIKKNLQIPLIYSDQELSLVEISGGKEAALAKVKLAEPQFFCGVETSAEPLVNPVDLGHALVPNDYQLLSPAQKLKLAAWMFFPGDSGARKVSVVSEIVDKEGKIVSVLSGDYEVAAGMMKEIALYAEGKTFAAGKYSMAVTFKESGKELYSEKRTLIVDDKRSAGREFGAFYADLKYDGPVPVYDRKEQKWSAAEWSGLWKRGPYQDIVVSFPNGNRFVFWRGSSNVPFWASAHNIGLTYEWLEAAWGRGGLVDCIEPLQDKKCLYSRPHIVSSTEARTVINWRYSLIDLDYTILDDEGAEETYTFYPDGFGVRNVKANIVPLTWHEANEMIVFIPAAVNPFDVLPSNAVKILALDGSDSAEITYPQPKTKWPENTPSVIRVNWSKKDANTPVMVSWKFKNFIVQYDGWKVDGRYISPSYWGVHYPVTRGYPTTVDAPPGWRERPGHASLTAINTEPFSTKRISAKHEQTVWAWLIGNADMPDSELIEISRSWANPVSIELLEGGEGGSYDQFQRAYTVRADGAADIKLRFMGDGRQKTFNPVFILKEFGGADAKVTIDGVEPKVYRVSAESSYMNDSLVVWIGEQVNNNAMVEIKKR